MQATLPQNDANHSKRSATLQHIRQLTQTLIAPKASAIDQGYYPKEEFVALGRAGAFCGHLSDFGGDFAQSVLVTTQIGRYCGTTAFLSWCHQVCGLYLDQSQNTALKGILARHANADTLGGTALSNPMKTWAGIESMRLMAKKQGNGYLVSGTLPWISHIAPDQYCAAVARGDDGDVFFLLQFDERRKSHWQLAPCPAFMAMEGSSTWRIVLDNYPVGLDDVISDDTQSFIRRIRGAFVLLQVGMAMGVIEGAIDDIGQAFAVSNAHLEDDAHSLQSKLDKLSYETWSLCDTPFDDSDGYFLDVLDVRTKGAMLCLQAAQMALLHQGAKGFVVGATPERRLREAQFVAVVTPAIKHLRYLSHQLMSKHHKR